MFFVIGGNGSHAGATAIYEQVTAIHCRTLIKRDIMVSLPNRSLSSTPRMISDGKFFYDGGRAVRKEKDEDGGCGNSKNYRQ